MWNSTCSAHLLIRGRSIWVYAKDTEELAAFIRNIRSHVIAGALRGSLFMAEGRLGMPSGTITLDLETWGVEHRFTMEPEKFVRLCGYKWKGDNEVRVTTDIEETREAVLSARWV